MWNRFIICLCAFILLYFNFIVFAFGESGCEKSNWASPLDYNIDDNDITGKFNPDSDPTKGHYGVDYKAADGDNVRAVAEGTIIKVDYQIKELSKPNPRTGKKIRGWGWYVVIKHTDGSTTLYAHLREDSVKNLIWEPVIKGQIIGKADATGGVTGDHLHLEYTPNGKWTDNPSKKDPHPCLVACPSEPAQLTLTGNDVAKVNEVYTATGGTEPYTYSISGGSINAATGQITSLPACTSGQPAKVTITATDSCSNQITKDVRMPNGVWVLQSSNSNICQLFQYANQYVELISGDTKNRYGITLTYNEYYYDGFLNLMGWKQLDGNCPTSPIEGICPEGEEADCGDWWTNGNTPDPCCVAGKYCSYTAFGGKYPCSKKGQCEGSSNCQLLTCYEMKCDQAYTRYDGDHRWVYISLYIYKYMCP